MKLVVYMKLRVWVRDFLHLHVLAWLGPSISPGCGMSSLVVTAAWSRRVVVVVKMVWTVATATASHTG